MAGEEDSSSKKNPPPSPPSSRQGPDDENPFVAFRRFADEQISSMLQSVTGLPSLVAPPRSDHWTIFTEEQNYKDSQIHHRQERNNSEKERGDLSSQSGPPNPGSQGSCSSGSSGNSSTPDSGLPSGSSRSRWSEIEQHRPSQLHRGSDIFDVDMFFDSFFDRFWFDDYISSRFLHPYQRPLFSNMLSADSPAWPVPYLMFSPYSPLHLERQAHYRFHRDQGVFSSLMSSLSLSSECDPEEPKWREAFEDLLRLENGKPMLDRELAVVAKPESGKEWLHNLVKRGSLGDHWKYVAETESQPWSTITLDRPDLREEERRYLPEPEQLDNTTKVEVREVETAKSEPLTELDMYDRFLTDIESQEREFFHGMPESPLLRFLLEDRRRSSYELEKDYRDDGTENWLELVSGEDKRSVPDSVEESTSNVPAPINTPAENFYVVSTRISTERVRLPDGSVQTKTVKTKRFADGREETNESVEVYNPQREQSPSDQPGHTTDQKKNGWFWKE